MEDVKPLAPRAAGTSEFAVSPLSATAGDIDRSDAVFWVREPVT